MLKFFYSRSSSLTMMATIGILFLGTVIKESNALTELGAFGTPTYDATYGFPTTIPILFDSDFTASQSPSTNNVYFTYETEGNGMDYYTDSGSISSVDAGPGTNLEFDIALPFTTTGTNGIPPIDVYIVTIKVDMFLKNAAGDMLMHAQTYTVTINLSGTEATHELDTSASTSTFTETTENENNSKAAPSTDPGDLTLAQAPGGPVGFGTDITLIADTADVEYKVWRDIGEPVEVFSDASLTNKIYEWPSELVGGHITEGAGATNELTLTLESVPVFIYNQNSIYVKLGIKYRDAAGGRRRRVLLRLPNNKNANGDGHRALERYEAASTTVAAEVKFAPMDEEEGSSSDGYTFSISLSWLVATTALAGTSLILA